MGGGKRNSNGGYWNICGSVACIGGMDKDLELVAQDDEFGRRIQDMNLVTPKRAKRK